MESRRPQGDGAPHGFRVLAGTRLRFHASVALAMQFRVPADRLARFQGVPGAGRLWVRGEGLCPREDVSHGPDDL